MELLLVFHVELHTSIVHNSGARGPSSSLSSYGPSGLAQRLSAQLQVAQAVIPRTHPLEDGLVDGLVQWIHLSDETIVHRGVGECS